MFFYSIKKAFVDTWYTMVPCIFINGITVIFLLLIVYGCNFFDLSLFSSFLFILNLFQVVCFVTLFFYSSVKCNTKRVRFFILAVGALLITDFSACLFHYSYRYYLFHYGKLGEWLSRLLFLIYLVFLLVLFCAVVLSLLKEKGIFTSSFFLLFSHPMKSVQLFSAFFLFIPFSFLFFPGIYFGSLFIWNGIYFLFIEVFGEEKEKKVLKENGIALKKLKFSELFRRE